MQQYLEAIDGSLLEVAKCTLFFGSEDTGRVGLLALDVVTNLREWDQWRSVNMATGVPISRARL